jgi:purine nucleosidase
MAHAQPAAAAAGAPAFIVDTDCGVDDAQALFVLLSRHQRGLLRVAAITCTHGNTSLHNVVQNVCAVLDVFGLGAAGIPVFRGCDRALLAASTNDGAAFHGADGLGNSGLGAPAGPARQAVHPTEHASAALLRLAREAAAAGAPLTLLTLGPLTNVALALRLGSAGGGPQLSACLARLVVMGGAHRAEGNTPVAPAAEFNVMEDPEAASMVFGTDWGAATVDLVTWELTKSSGLAPAALAAWLHPQPATPRAAWLAAASAHLVQKTAAFAPEAYARNGFYIPDPLAACVAVAPQLVVAQAATVGVLVELAGKWGRGATLVDWRGEHAAAAPRCVRLVSAVHGAAVQALLVESVRE